MGVQSGTGAEIRTRTALRPAEFKSAASTSSATPAGARHRSRSPQPVTSTTAITSPASVSGALVPTSRRAAYPRGMETQTTLDPSDLTSTLGAAVKGRVIGQDDPEYDTARTVVYGGVDPRPAAIVKVADAADVAAVIEIARDTGLPLAVRSGGHSGAGYGSVDDGIVIDVRPLNSLDIDPVARTAWAGSGLTADDR